MKRDDEPSRLSDHSDLDPWMAGLLRSREPYRAPPGRKQRLLLGLGRSKPRPRAPFLLRAAVVAVLVGCGAFASAALGPWRGWIGRAYERLVPRPAPAAAPLVTEHARVHRPAPVAPAAVVMIAPAPAPAPTPPPSAAPRIHHALAGSLPAAPAPRSAEQDTELVADGLRALRLDHDPPHARALLAAYLARHPSGALAEEALALSIEAAVSHHDPDAPALAARYLQRYPSGPFRALALQAAR